MLVGNYITGNIVYSYYDKETTGQDNTDWLKEEAKLVKYDEIFLCQITGLMSDDSGHF